MSCWCIYFALFDFSRGILVKAGEVRLARLLEGRNGGWLGAARLPVLCDLAVVALKRVLFDLELRRGQCGAERIQLSHKCRQVAEISCLLGVRYRNLRLSDCIEFPFHFYDNSKNRRT